MGAELSLLFAENRKSNEHFPLSLFQFGVILLMYQNFDVGEKLATNTFVNGCKPYQHSVNH